MLDRPMECWFCRRADNNMVFDTEFDTAVHIDCIKKALKEHVPTETHPEHPEAKHMKYLLEENENED